jgi:hypothetical protein
MAYNASQITNDCYDCTPSDTDANAGFGFRVYTTAGDVTIKTLAGRTRKVGSVQVGETINVAFSKIMDTGTDAVGITVFTDSPV